MCSWLFKAPPVNSHRSRGHQKHLLGLPQLKWHLRHLQRAHWNSKGLNGNVQCVVGSSNNFYVLLTTWPTPLIACWVGVPWWLHVAQCPKPNGHASLAIGSSRSFWHWLCSWLFYGRYWCASCVAGSLAWRQSNQELLGCLYAFSIWPYYLELCETNISL